MKAKKISLLLFLIYLGGLVFAQDFQISFSEPQKVKSTVSISTSGKIGDEIFITKADEKRNVYSILKFNKSLGLENEFSFKQKNCKDISNCIDKHYDYLRTLYFKDQILLFFENYDKKNDSRDLFCQRMSLDGKFVGDLTRIDNVEAKRKSNSGSYRIESSEDSTKFLVIKNLPFEKKEDEKFAFKVYDGNLKNISNSLITLPYKDKDASIVDYYLSNKGDIYMLLNVDIEKKKREKGEDDQFFSLLCVNASTDNSLSDFRVRLPKRNIVDISLRIDNDKETVLCSGFYSDIKTTAKMTRDIDGFFYMSVDVNSKKVISESFKNLDEELIKQLSGKKQSKTLKEGKGISQAFRICDFVKRSDGSSLIVAENRYSYTVQHCTTSNGVTTCTYTTHYVRNNIFAISISSKGEVLSFFDIPKEQYSSNDGGAFSSYLLIQKGDRIFFIYNDNPKNMDPERKTIRDIKPFRNPKKGILVAAELLPDGKYKKQELLVNKKLKMIVRPEDGFKLEDGVYIAPISTLKSKKLGFVRFELK